MQDIFERAARLGVQTEYWDAFGSLRNVEPQVLSRLVEVLSEDKSAAKRILPRSIVIRGDAIAEIALAGSAGQPFTWEILSDQQIAAGQGISPFLKLEQRLPLGIFRLRVTITGPDGPYSETTPIIVCPRQAYQRPPGAPDRMWALAVQLYAVRSRRNWGHGDFSDLLSLIDLAADFGASAVGLNPLHSMFDDRGGEASPYSPNSRLFLNPLYIDVEAIPEFPGIAAAGLEEKLATLRKRDLIDYSAVAEVKWHGLKLAYRFFVEQGLPERRSTFKLFRQAHPLPLARFACFEFLRRELNAPWWEWPDAWRRGDEAALAQLHVSREADISLFEFVQWVAHEQLDGCRQRARLRAMPIGLYIDIAVGARTDGFDAWCDQDAALPGIEVGAPPDNLNRHGQNWGLAGFNPLGLERRQFAPFRQLLDAGMRYAGAVRLDHALGLQRLYLIPRGMRADQGTYVRFPFQELLATIALASVQNRCVVVGEDLGTVPALFRETLADWGVWSYQVMLFERTDDGAFAAPESYRPNALVTFATHDLPTFAGWRAHRDLDVKRALNIEPGESEEDRDRSLEALRQALVRHGFTDTDFPSVASYLADTPSRLLVISMEDLLGVNEQVNVPGTVDEHPNWRRPVPVLLEELAAHPGLAAVAGIMRSAGRCARPRR
jgi:4-alpha-glucanotransferase